MTFRRLVLARSVTTLAIALTLSIAGSANAQDPHAGLGADPHDHESAQGPGSAQPLPRDDAREDPSVPVGSLFVHVVEPSGAPMPSSEVTLGIIHNTVAKGESRTRVTAKADNHGVARFDGLETGTGVAYRAMILRDGATFSAPPVQLTPKSGVSALVHVYPVTRELPPYLVSQSLLYTEVKDDRIQIQQVFKIYNFGPTAWVPENVVIPLPPEFTAFSAQQGMTDVGLDAVEKKGLRLRGTFSPGEHEIDFRWQLPYTGQASLSFDVGMTPHLAAMRVMAPSSKNMKLEVQDFPAARPTMDGMGQRALLTEKQFRREDPPVTAISVRLRGLPTEGPGKLVATFLAIGGVALGLVLGSRKPKPRSTKEDRQRLLEDLEALEKAHASGDVGPKTYERSRREILDDIARTFASEAPTKKLKKKSASA